VVLCSLLQGWLLHPDVMQTAPNKSGVLNVAADTAIDTGLYRELFSALANFETTVATGGASPRCRAFYAVLRSMLARVLQEASDQGRHLRLVAAHVWFMRYRPCDIPCDAAAAAAMAASLSVQAGSQMEGQGTRTPGQHLLQAMMQQHPPPAMTAQCHDDGDYDNSHDKGLRLQQQQGNLVTLAPSSCGAGGVQGRLADVRAVRASWAAPRLCVFRLPGELTHREGCSSGICEVLAGASGLIPLGCLPSSRIGNTVVAAAAPVVGAPTSITNDACECANTRAAAQATAHAALVADVGAEMHRFARGRARLEQELCRRAEAATAAAVGSVCGEHGCQRVLLPCTEARVRSADGELATVAGHHALLPPPDAPYVEVVSALPGCRRLGAFGGTSTRT
jgi:hypothetical protein